MKQRREFYGDLGQEKYLQEVRRFVPKYDRLVQIVASKIIESAPQNILDIGSGVGNVDAMILAALKDAKVTCLEPSEPMAKACKQMLQEYGPKAKVIIAKARDFSFNTKYDAVFSNLVLHNISAGEKQKVLAGIRESLNEKGIFIWGDLIRYNPIITELLVGYRHALAWFKGADFRFVMEDLRKERTLDSKLSIEETIALCKKAGFRNPRLIWQTYLGTAGVFYTEK